MDLSDPIVLLTAALVIFAGAQVWVVHRAEHTRKVERDADEKRALDLAYQTVWAEHFRLDSLADQWDEADLVELSFLGILRPEEVLPQDPAALIQPLARLGVEAGYLGGVALTVANDLARQIALINASVQGLGPGAHLRDRIALARGVVPQIDQQEAGIRKAARELSLLLWDALQHSPRANEVRTLTFSDELSSDIGRQAVRALGTRGIMKE